MKKIILILLIFISSCTTETPVNVISIPDTTPMWPQFGYDARHTGNPNSPKVPLPPVMNGIVEWCDTVTTISPSDGSECSVDSKGNIYFLSPSAYSTARLIKYNPNGSRIWERDTLLNDAFFGIAISKDETKIYYSDFLHISCRDSSGNLIWRINERGAGTPVIDDENNIYINCNGALTKFSPTGEKLWSLTDVNGYSYSAVFDRDFNLYYPCIKFLHNVILKINKQGSIVWTFDMKTNINYSTRSVIIDGYNNIYYQNDSLYCISKDGKRKWSYNNFRESVPAITNDNKIILQINNGFIKLDTAGDIIWSKSIVMGQSESNVAIDDNNNIYFNYTNSGLSVISLEESGNTRWNLQNITNGFVIPSPALIPGGKLFTYPKRPARVYCIK